MKACHSTASCHLGTTRTLQMLERFYGCISMNMCTRWWLHNCLKCHTRTTSRLGVRWPFISIPLPAGPGIAISADCLGPLPATPRSNIFILLFPYRVSRRTNMLAASAVKFIAEGTDNSLFSRRNPPLGCPRSITSHNGCQFCSLSYAVYKLLGVRKINTSPYHPNGNGDVERANHTGVQMLATAINQRQDY